MKRPDITTILGILIGCGTVLTGIILRGDIGQFLDWAGLMITLGGSFGALLIFFRSEDIKMVIQITKQAFVRKDEDVATLNERFVYLAQKARKEGLLVLEDELEEIEDPFMRNGLRMVIDGFEPDAIRHILNTELEALETRHQLGQNLYKTWGTLSPAFGMIGTLIGLIVMLADLDDPDAIGPGMAVALITTFYGIMFANLLFNPIAGKLAVYSEQEMQRKEAVIEALLALQSGINPRLLKEQLKAYLSPAERERLEEEERRSREEKAEGATMDV